jgi:hypothetical protein
MQPILWTISIQDVGDDIELWEVQNAGTQIGCMCFNTNDPISCTNIRSEK